MLNSYSVILILILGSTLTEAVIFDPVSNAFKSLGQQILNSFLNFFVSIYRWMRDVVLSLLRGLSAASQETLARANATFTEVVLEDDLTSFIAKIFHTGELPVEYYMKEFDTTQEVDHIDEIVEVLVNIHIVAITVLGCFAVILLVLCVMTRGIDNDFKTNKILLAQRMRRGANPRFSHF